MVEKIDEIEVLLREEAITPIEANMKMRAIQQELMGKKMQKMMKERNQQIPP